MNTKNIGAYLKSRRKEKGFTLTELAAKSGVSHPYISQIENGKFIPSPEILSRLAPHLEMSRADLMVKAGHLSFDDKSEREWDDLMYGPYSEEMIKELKDIKIALTRYAGKYYYNGHQLSDQDRQRILDMLKALFPEYSSKE